MKDKDQYTLMVNSRISSKLPTDNLEAPEVKFSAERCKNLISPEGVKSYVENLCNGSGQDSYIPYRPGMVCPAELFATMGGRRINILTCDEKVKRLCLLKTAGGDGQLVNVLHRGAHFERLAVSDDTDTPRQQCQQIETNFYQGASPPV